MNSWKGFPDELPPNENVMVQTKQDDILIAKFSQWSGWESLMKQQFEVLYWMGLPPKMKG